MLGKKKSKFKLFTFNFWGNKLIKIINFSICLYLDNNFFCTHLDNKLFGSV